MQITYELPLAEVVFDFYDKLKSVSRGYASLDYELTGYRPADLVKLDILVNGEPRRRAVDHRPPRARLPARPRRCAEKLKEVIPRQMFEVAIQAAIGGKIIARETVTAMRKNVHRQVLRRRHLAASASSSRSRKRARSA